MFRILKFLLRVGGFLLIALAIITGISDASTSIAQSQYVFAPLGQLWFELSPQTLSQLQPGIQRNIHPLLWDPVIQTVLTWPAWAVFAPLGMLLLWLGASRRREKPAFA